MSFRILRSLVLIVTLAGIAAAQAPARLTLQEAVEIAVKNHPQIQASQNEVNFANQQVVINRSSYYPTISGELTASQGNDLSRIGAGELSASGCSTGSDRGRCFPS